MITYIIILSIGLIGISYYLIKYFNIFQRLKQNIEKSISDLVTEYKRRIDLINDLKKVVSSYTDFEKDTYKEVTVERKDKMNEIFKEVIKEREVNELKDLVDNQIKKQIEDNKKPTIGEIFKESLNIKAVGENYPKLKAFKEYIKLINQLEITEDRINESRRDYNNNVIVYNKLVKVIPTNLVALIFGFRYNNYYTL